jgi:hypothetical protein
MHGKMSVSPCKCYFLFLALTVGEMCVLCTAVDDNSQKHKPAIAISTSPDIARTATGAPVHIGVLANDIIDASPEGDICLHRLNSRPEGTRIPVRFVDVAKDAGIAGTFAQAIHCAPVP